MIVLLKATGLSHDKILLLYHYISNYAFLNGTFTDILSHKIISIVIYIDLYYLIKASFGYGNKFLSPIVLDYVQ